MLESGADANAVNLAGQTPLHISAMHGFDTLVAPLAKFDGKVNAKDKKGNTPLHVAARCGFPDVGRALKAHGAESVPNMLGKLPTDIATSGDPGCF